MSTWFPILSPTQMIEQEGINENERKTNSEQMSGSVAFLIFFPTQRVINVWNSLPGK